MKKWAFYKEGNEWRKIGLRAALSKEKEEPGQWRRRTYYSTHSPASNRLPMHIHKKANGTDYFAYNPRQESEIERCGGGESLAHNLYKTAISELGHTTLKLSNLGEDVPVKFFDAQTEKRVHINGRHYDLDVFVKFTSQSKYQQQWNGELGIEVHHTNKVTGQKLNDLKALRIPVIEVSINEKLAYKTADQDSTHERERKYIDFLKGVLSKYLWSKVLSNPKSIYYLENENENLYKDIKDLRSQLNHSKMLLERANAALVEKEELVSNLRMQMDELKTMGVFKFLSMKRSNK